LFLDLAEPLHKIIDRFFDLHPVVKDHYYHPKMAGSWSIKAVLPCIAPHMNYAEPEGIDEAPALRAPSFAGAVTNSPSMQGIPTGNILRRSRNEFAQAFRAVSSRSATAR